MKLKRFFITGIILIAAGIITGGTAFAMSGFRLTENIVPGFQSNTFIYGGSDALRKVEIDDSNMSVIIQQGGSELICEYYEDNSSGYTFIEESGTLKIKRKSHPSISLIPNPIKPDLRITLPESYSGEVSVDTSNCSVTASGISVRELEIEDSNGDIEITGSSIERLDLETFNGTIDLSSSKIGLLDIDDSNGSVNLIDCTLESDCEIENSNGTVILNSISQSKGKLEIGTMNGTVQLVSIKTPSLEVENRNGSIIFDKVDANYIGAKTNNSNITGSLSGSVDEYRIEVRCFNGSSNLDNQKNVSAKRALRVGTQNGDIKLEFDR